MVWVEQSAINSCSSWSVGGIPLRRSWNTCQLVHLEWPEEHLTGSLITWNNVCALEAKLVWHVSSGYCCTSSIISWITSIVVSNDIIEPVSNIQSLGVTLDWKPSFDQHVNNTCRSCYHHIRALRHIWDLLSDEVFKTVACSVIGSRLD